jgi:hypothetical protein
MGRTKPDSGVTLEPDAIGVGVREWLTSLGSGQGKAAAFDTRAADTLTSTTHAVARGATLPRRSSPSPPVWPAATLTVTACRRTSLGLSRLIS